jgi:hypothetical protein
MKYRLLASGFLVVAVMAAPVLASADSTSHLQTQLIALLEQLIQTLTAEIGLLEQRTNTLPVGLPVFCPSYSLPTCNGTLVPQRNNVNGCMIAPSCVQDTNMVGGSAALGILNASLNTENQHLNVETQISNRCNAASAAANIAASNSAITSLNALIASANGGDQTSALRQLDALVAQHVIHTTADVTAASQALDSCLAVGSSGGSTLDLPPVGSADAICVGQGELGAPANMVDESNPLVQISKQALLGLGISQQYFNNHFKFLCAVDALGDRRVRWEYIIGEYATTLEDSLGFITQAGSTHYTSSFPNSLHALSEVQTIISKNAAAKAMQACIGDFTNASVSLALPFNVYSSDTPDVPAAYARPFLSARSTRQQSTAIGDVTRYEGQIDLTTSACERRASGSIHAPLPVPTPSNGADLGPTNATGAAQASGSSTATPSTGQ